MSSHNGSALPVDELARQLEALPPDVLDGLLARQLGVPAFALRLARRAAGLPRGEHVIVFVRGQRQAHWRVLRPYADIEGG